MSLTDFDILYFFSYFHRVSIIENGMKYIILVNDMGTY